MSRLLAYVPEALLSIWRHKTRSLLSVIGMVIGIASVIAVLGLSQAGANGMKQMLATGGDPGFVVAIDESSDNPAAATMYYRDAGLMQAYAPGAIAKAIPGYNQETFKATASKKSEYVNLSSLDVPQQSGLTLRSGRFINQDDIAAAANVGIISADLADKLFPGQDAVGHALNVQTQRIEIVGVFTVSGSLFNSLNSDALYVPYTTAHNIDTGAIDFIQFWPASGVSGVDAIAAARAAMLRIHPRGRYNIVDQGSFLNTFGRILSAIGVGLTFIGGIALLVAGVGIMNIMLVSVTERTREIGIRKSIGASASDISAQFLIEAALLSIFGGLLGTLLGVAGVMLGRGIIEQSIGAAPVPWFMVISIAAGFSIGIGIGFGFYPAARAGRLDPVEALRG